MNYPPPHALRCLTNASDSAGSNLNRVLTFLRDGLDGRSPHAGRSIAGSARSVRSMAARRRRPNASRAATTAQKKCRPSWRACITGNDGLI